MQEPVDLTIDPDARSYRYFKNAVSRHWNPAEIELSQDVERLVALDDTAFEDLERTLALFGAGEQAVTEDLAPLAVVLSDVGDQLFVTTQLYEEAKHADFFDRYWREVIHPAEDERGLVRSSPTDARWFSDAYDELFARNEAAMERLLVDDTPENRARAYCHYHLMIEGVLAQTGYYGVQRDFSGDGDGLPRLPGLVEGFSNIRSDEGRHVGFGMAKLKGLTANGVSEELLYETITDLLGLTRNVVAASRSDEGLGLDTAELTAYAAEKHVQRMDQIVEAGPGVPDIEELVTLDG